MSKHICHITTIHPHLDTRIFHKQCVSLVKMGYKVTLLCNEGPSGFYDGVEVISLNLKYGGLMDRFFNLADQLYNRALEVNADAYQFHDPDFLIAALKLKKKGKIVVYDAHEDLPRQILTKPQFGAFKRKLYATVFEWLEDYVVKRLDGMITADEEVTKRFAKINSNTILLSNYVLLNQFNNEKQLANRKFSAVYVGGLTKIRGVYEMVAAMKSVPGILALGGNFDEAEIEEKTKSLSSWDRVDYRGMVNAEERDEMMAESKIGLVVLHPVKKYLTALPTKLFEYMASGIPVISSNIKMWKDIVDDANCGFCIDPLDINALSEKMNWLLENPNEAQKLGDNGYQAVKKKYSWESEEPKLQAFYNNLLS